MKYRFLVKFERIVEVEAENKEEAEDSAISEMLDDMANSNETLENELEIEPI